MCPVSEFGFVRFHTRRFVTCEGPTGCPPGLFDDGSGRCVDAPPPEDQQEEKSDGPPAPEQCVGNPCDAATGNKYQSEVDFAGADGVPGFSRHYNSRLDTDMGLGVGWTASFGKRLELYGTTVQVRQGTGRGEPFTCPETAGSCTGDPDSRLLLSKDAAGYTLTYPEGGAERYDAEGRLVSETDTRGRTTSYGYNGSSQLSAVTGPFGHSLGFAWNGDHLASITDPSGKIYAYAYDANDNLIEVAYPDGAAKRYHYENAAFPNHLTGISYREPSGTVTRYSTYAYDGDGKAVLTEHAGGMEAYSLAYDSDTQTTVTDAAGTQEVMSFAKSLGVRNLVSKLNQADGKELVQTFDANNNLTCKQDEEGGVTTYTYNSAHQRVSMTEGLTGDCANPVSGMATRTTRWQYLSAALDLPTVIETPSVQSGQQKRVSLTYGDPRFPLLPTAIRQSGFTPSGAPLSRTVSLIYNDAGQVASIDGPRTDVGDVTTLSYHACASGGACGQLAAVTNALGHTTTFDAYDAAGRLTRMTDPNGLVTTYGYDARGRVVAMTQTPPGGAARTTSYAYDAAGNVTSVSFPDGVALGYVYDAARMLRQVSDNLGNRISYGYDLRGNRTEERTHDPDGTLVRALARVYDARNYLAAVNRGGATTEQLHDALGNLTRVTNPNEVAGGGPSTTHAYDALNRLIETVDTLSGVTRFGYDVEDRLTRVRAPNDATTEFVYDDLGNLLAEHSPDRGATTYTYDAAGNVTSITDARGITAAYAYDALNRVTAIDYPGTDEDVLFVYDAIAADAETACGFGIGRLCRVTDPSGVTDHAYDAFGNVLEQAKTELANTYRTAYTYDAGDRVTAIAYPDGRSVRYARDRLGRIQVVSATVKGVETAITADRAYRADGLLAGQTFGNGLNEVRQYNLKGELTYQSLGSADTRLYAYDPNGNLIQKQSLPEVAAYDYDRLDRLTGTDREGVGEFYTYDPNGNRLSDQAATYAYQAASNRMTVADGRIVTLDAAGNTLDDGTGRTYRYNQAGRLVEVQVNGITVGTYRYNYLGQRTRKVTSQDTALYHYDPAGNLILETIAARTARAYVWADAEPLAQIDTVLKNGKTLPPKVPRDKLPAKATRERLTFLHSDHLATPRLATDRDGIKVWGWEGEAFGNAAPNEDPDGDRNAVTVNLRFPGQYHDAGTALTYNWSRYYDSRTGRYLTSDPIGLPGGPNSYAYVSNNPSRWRDRSGLCPVCAVPLLGKAGGVLTAIGTGILVGLGASAPSTPSTGLDGTIQSQSSESDDRRARGRGDPVAGQEPYNPGRDCEGKCNPCREPEIWEAPGSKHGSTSGTHWHGIVWNQDPATCMCYPKRVSGPSPDQLK